MTGSIDSTGMTGATGRQGPADRQGPAAPASPAFSRRALLGTGLGTAAALTVVGSGPAHAAPRTAGASARRRGQAFLAAAMDAYPDHGAIRLTQSYTDQAGLFSTAFTYDNALAILAHLAVGTEDGRARAVMLGDALIHAQEHDPAYDDGLLRQAYNVGPYVYYDGVPQPDGFVRADGTANVGTQFGFTGTAVGDMAWAGIALSALARRTGKRRFLAAAVRIGEWIERTGRTDEPLGGYKFGVNGANEKLPFTSTEHNTDLVCLFGRLARLTGDRVWWTRRARAEAFVKRMWEAGPGRVGRLLLHRYQRRRDRQQIADPRGHPDLDPPRTRLRPVRALPRLGGPGPGRSRPRRAPQQHGPRRAVVRGRHLQLRQPPRQRGRAHRRVPAQAQPQRRLVRGHRPPRARPARPGRAWRRDPRPAPAHLPRTRPGPPGHRPDRRRPPLPARSGIVSASSPLDTGFGFGYYPYRHTGATAWYLMAAVRANPLRA